MPEYSKLNTCAYAAIIFCSFTMAFSMPAGRSFMALALVFLIVDLVKRQQFPVFSVSTWIAVAFMAVAVWATINGANPDIGVKKLRKLLWYIGIPVIATLVSARGNVFSVLSGYSLGVGILSIRNMCISISRGIRAERAGDPDWGFYRAVVDAGSMTDAQRIMLAVMITVGFIMLCYREKARTAGWWILLLIQLAALVFSFKRGSWLCTFIMVAVFVLLKTNWKYLLVLFVLGAMIFSLPFCRERLSGLKDEFNADGGGRMTMWRKVVPGVMRDYPHGVGIKSLTNEMMRKYAPEVEPDRNHVHSNPLQILVATGWPGLILYSLWMLMAVFESIRLCLITRKRSDAENLSALLLLLMLVALLANGLIEYNFLDAEIVLVYCIIMGAVAGMLKYVKNTPNPASIAS